MSKTIMWVHPETTFVLEVPDILYEIINKAINLRLIKTKFIKTDNKMRGMQSNIVIIDEWNGNKD